ncbi:autotransporter outer membrane beta-barrel domain-containing protein [Helicobacter sp. 11S02596-1]|uniref:autotransporter outer membrane beta-barrel domain-containing protein n=1 Tax=Helicobacter sp. 11S02596-1 TaxID=1476194 RepID=UPI0015DDF137|nr:autotransporter outer membrane beta-barrel domain-containing protein [Helicobacter sp. 11S02596-1]
MNLFKSPLILFGCLCILITLSLGALPNHAETIIKGDGACSLAGDKSCAKLTLTGSPDMDLVDVSGSQGSNYHLSFKLIKNQDTTRTIELIAHKTIIENIPDNNPIITGDRTEVRFDFKNAVYSTNKQDLRFHTTIPAGSYHFDGAYGGEGNSSLKGYAFVGNILVDENPLSPTPQFVFSNGADMQGNFNISGSGSASINASFINSSLEGNIINQADGDIKNPQIIQTITFSGNSLAGFALKGTSGEKAEVETSSGTIHLIFDDGAKAQANITAIEDENTRKQGFAPAIIIDIKNGASLDGDIALKGDASDTHTTTLTLHMDNAILNGEISSAKVGTDGGLQEAYGKRLDISLHNAKIPANTEESGNAGDIVSGSDLKLKASGDSEIGGIVSSYGSSEVVFNDKAYMKNFKAFVSSINTLIFSDNAHMENFTASGNSSNTLVFNDNAYMGNFTGFGNSSSQMTTQLTFNPGTYMGDLKPSMAGDITLRLNGAEMKNIEAKEIKFDAKFNASSVGDITNQNAGSSFFFANTQGKSIGNITIAGKLSGVLDFTPGKDSQSLTIGNIQSGVIPNLTLIFGEENDDGSAIGKLTDEKYIVNSDEKTPSKLIFDNLGTIDFKNDSPLQAQLKNKTHIGLEDSTIPDKPTFKGILGIKRTNVALGEAGQKHSIFSKSASSANTGIIDSTDTNISGLEATFGNATLEGEKLIANNATDPTDPASFYTLTTDSKNVLAGKSSDGVIGFQGDNFKKTIAFVFTKNALDISRGESGFTGTIAGGTADSTYAFYNAGIITQETIKNALDSSVLGTFVFGGETFFSTDLADSTPLSEEAIKPKEIAFTHAVLTGNFSTQGLTHLAKLATQNKIEASFAPGTAVYIQNKNKDSVYDFSDFANQSPAVAIIELDSQTADDKIAKASIKGFDGGVSLIGSIHDSKTTPNTYTFGSKDDPFKQASWLLTGDSNVANLELFNANATRQALVLSHQDTTSNLGSVIDLRGNRTANPHYRTLEVEHLSMAYGVIRMGVDTSRGEGDKLNVESLNPSVLVDKSEASNALQVFLENGPAEGFAPIALVNIENGDDSSEAFTPASYQDGIWIISPVVGVTKTDETTKTTYELQSFLVASNTESVQSIQSVLGTFYRGFRIATNNLNLRMGELRSIEAKEGVWARVINGLGSDKQNNQDFYTTLQAGYDHQFSLKSGITYLGIDAEASLISSKGAGYDSSGRNLGVGVYNTYLFENGWYVDTSLKYLYLNERIHSSENTRSSPIIFPENPIATHAILLGGEVGYRYELDNLITEAYRDVIIHPYTQGYYLEPQAEIITGYMSGNDWRAKVNAKDVALNLKANFPLIWRVGLVLGKHFKTTKGLIADIRVGFSYINEANTGGDSTIIQTEPIALAKPIMMTMPMNQKLGLSLGSNIKFNEDWRFYATIGRSFLGNYNMDYHLNIGGRWSFGKKPHQKNLPAKSEEKIKSEQSKEERQTQ